MTKDVTKTSFYIKAAVRRLYFVQDALAFHKKDCKEPCDICQSYRSVNAALDWLKAAEAELNEGFITKKYFGVEKYSLNTLSSIYEST